jgi:hypothetical protein
MTKPLYDDPVVAEIHGIRAKMLADYEGDHRKLMEQVRAREKASDRTVIAAPPPPSTAPSTEQSVGPDGEQCLS